MMKSKRVRKVFSLNLICYLRCNGIQEVSVGFNSETKKVYFVFEDNDSLEKMVNEYKDRDTKVRLHDFIAEFKQLKEEMYKHTKAFTK